MNNKPNKLPPRRHKNVGLFHGAGLSVSRWHLAKAQFSHDKSHYSASSYLQGRRECDSKGSRQEMKADGLGTLV